ncbi:MAG: chloride channel protein [Anaerolineales bacterium]|nr:chloride channel protein [Anaerolineales bacterium]
MKDPDITHQTELTRSPVIRKISKWLVERLSRFQVSEEVVLITTALIVGMGTGLGAVGFRYLIRGVEWVGYDWFPRVFALFGTNYVVLIPALGGLIVGLLIFYFAREAKGHGVPEVMEAVALRGGRIRPIVALVKVLASSISIGSGGSVGREGPIAQIGSALGSTVGQLFRLSDERIRNLVACGAAAGIAATFNAPIAGVIFSLEVILGEFSVRYFSTVVISAVAASTIGQAVFGNVPAFPISTQYSIVSVWEFGLYPILGVLAAILGVIFVRSLYWSEDLFDSWKSVPEWFKPAVGGALLGIMALVYPLVTNITWERMPHIYNVGYDVIESALSNELLLGTVLVLLVLKLIATDLTLGSGGSGGVFAPSLFMGSMLGTAFGLGANILFPEITAPPGAYALVGMAAVFAAGAHAPITAVLILFELTGDYRIILPLMLTVVIATILAQSLLGGESIYTLKLSRRGVRLQRGHDIDVMQSVSVGEVMTTDIEPVSDRMTLVGISELLSQTRHHGFPLVDDAGRLVGVVTVTDVDQAIARNVSRKAKASEIGTPHDLLVVAHPDESMGEALQRMGRRGLGRLPVVSREATDELLGMVRRDDIIEAYNVGLTRRAELQHRVKRMHLRDIDGTQFVELRLSEGDHGVGRSISKLADMLPEDCVLVSIRRDGRILIPHGSTRLQAGDSITAFVHQSVAGKVRSCLLS